MYIVSFLPKEEFESLKLSTSLSRMKLMRQFRFEGLQYKDFHFLKLGKEVILYYFHRNCDNNGYIYSCKFLSDGCTQQLLSATIPDFPPRADVMNRRVLFTLPLLPLVGVSEEMRDGNIKISFNIVPGCYENAVIIKNVAINIEPASRIVSHDVKAAGNYFAVCLCLRLKRQGGGRRSQRKTNFMVLVQTKRNEFGNYEFVEICRQNIADFIDGGAVVHNMVVNEIQDAILFHVKEDLERPSKDHILVYNINSKIMENTIYIGEYDLDPSKMHDTVYFINHHIYGGIIVTVLPDMIKVFAKSAKDSYRIIHKVPYKNEEGSIITSCIRNRNSQILFFRKVRDKIMVHDLFDFVDCKTIPYKVEDMFQKRHFLKCSETGEEIFVWNHRELCVYAYKSSSETLLALTAHAVSKMYTASQLKEMKLPTQLYRFL